MSGDSNKIVSMTSGKEHSTGSVPYVLGGFLMLLVLDSLYPVFAGSSYSYLGFIFIPLYIYTGVGIVKHWPSSRNILLVLAMLLFVGMVTSFVVIFFVAGRSISTDPGLLARVISGLAISVIMYFYLGRESVKSYFKPAN